MDPSLLSWLSWQLLRLLQAFVVAVFSLVVIFVLAVFCRQMGANAKVWPEASTVVVTNCTARKRTGARPPVRFELGMAERTVGDTAQRWLSALQREPEGRPVAELYKGRAFTEARTVATRTSAALLVVSAGLGLVSAGAVFPAYDLTPTDGRSDFSVALAQRGWTLPEWWAALTAGAGLREALVRSKAQTVFVALPATYLSLVAGDLERAMAEKRELFIFTSPAGRRVLTADLRTVALPYDERLELFPPFAGTRADFPQRAMRHFTSTIWATGNPMADPHGAVIDAMAAAIPRAVPKRLRADDEEIRLLISGSWASCGGNSAALLRHLRDVLLVSCEQGRFARLRREVAAGMLWPVSD
jgi:hypothetical protein